MTCCSAIACSCSRSRRARGHAGVPVIGVNRSTYYRWKPEVERSGLEMLRPRERRRPQMPNQLSVLVEQQIVAFALGHPGLGPRRIATRLARPQWGGLIVCPNGVYKTLVRHGLNTRAKRLALVAGYRAPYEPPREPAPEPHIESSRPGELVGIDCFFVGRLHGAKGPVWQITAIDTYRVSPGPIWSSARPRADRRADLRARPTGRRRAPTGRLAAGTRAHRQRQRVRPPRVRRPPARRRHAHPDPLRAPADQRPRRTPHRTILEECWRPAFARYLQVRFSGLRRDLASYLHDYNHDREHHGRTTDRRCPADLVYGARKMEPR